MICWQSLHGAFSLLVQFHHATMPEPKRMKKIGFSKSSMIRRLIVSFSMPLLGESESEEDGNSTKIAGMFSDFIAAPTQAYVTSTSAYCLFSFRAGLFFLTENCTASNRTLVGTILHYSQLNFPSSSRSVNECLDEKIQGNPHLGRRSTLAATNTTCVNK